MAQIGQIIPRYGHPHSETYINDNTEFTPAVAEESDESFKSIFVITSAKGRDGVMVEKTNQTDYLKEFGKPNFQLYGQPGYNAHAFLGGNAVKAYILRVMPEDALYANSVVLAKVKPESGKLTIKLEVQALTSVTDKEDIVNQVDLLTSPEADENGYLTYPIIAPYVLGRGTYGDAFRFRLSSSAQLDKENDYRNYRLEVLELDGSLTSREVFTGTLTPDALSGDNSLYLTDKIEDPDTGSSIIGLYINNENLSAIYNLYKGAVPETTVTEELFPFFTGKLKDGTTLPGYTIELDAENPVSLDNPEGIPLAGGSDGSFGTSVDAGVREQKIIEAYTAAFAGTIDPAIKSKFRTPANLLLDAGYPDEVKRQLVNLAVNRYDAPLQIDGGILNTADEAISWGESFYDIADRVFSKNFQHYRIRDPFSGKSIPVTMTYFFAKYYPAHVAAAGNETPFTGEEYARLLGAVKNSLKPIVDADDNETKEALYNLRLNYFQTIGENNFVRATQSTAQNIWSDLSEENNMAVTLDMKRELEALNNSLTYDFAEPEDRKGFTEDGNRMLEDKFTGKARSMEVRFEMNAFEEERSILHCYAEVIFRSMAKTSIIEIDINKRV